MRIFIAGATGVVGSRLIPLLTGAGHSVIGTSRSRNGAGTVSRSGGIGVVMDPVDAVAVKAAVAEARPQVVMHQLTALSGPVDLRHFDQSLALTNRLRTEALDHLLEAAIEVGAERFVAQSYTGWPNPRAGGPIKTEADPLDPDPDPDTRQTLGAIRHLETAVTQAPDLTGLVLRYGNLYGPGTALGEGGNLMEMVRRRRLPVIGGGTGVWSHSHIDDAATATVAAIEAGTTGLYNVVDDEPAPVAEWLPYLAEAIGASRPRRLPRWIARPLVGSHGVSMMTRVRGSSNAKARAELGWEPAYPSWRLGFRSGL